MVKRQIGNHKMNEDTTKNERAVIGDNNPPLDKLEVFTEALETLNEEAENWLDGVAIDNQAQADELNKLITLTVETSKEVEQERVDRRKPYLDANKKIQAEFKPLLDKADLIVSTCKKALLPFLKAQEELKRANEEAAKKEAEQAAREAEAARILADKGNIKEQERVRELEGKQKEAEQVAKYAGKDKAQAKGSGRAVGLRSVWEVAIEDETKAVRALWGTHKQQFIDLALNIAKSEVKNGKRAIDGFTITEEKKAV